MFTIFTRYGHYYGREKSLSLAIKICIKEFAEKGYGAIVTNEVNNVVYTTKDLE